MFPATRGDPVPYWLWSGEFYASTISFGWGDTYEHAKMPLQPARPDVIGAGLWIRVIRLDQAAEGTTFAATRLVQNGTYFFAAWPVFPTPGQWMLIATAGANWGCFVLDRPIEVVAGTLAPAPPEALRTATAAGRAGGTLRSRGRKALGKSGPIARDTNTFATRSANGPLPRIREPNRGSLSRPSRTSHARSSTLCLRSGNAARARPRRGARRRAAGAA